MSEFNLLIYSLALISVAAECFAGTRLILRLKGTRQIALLVSALLFISGGLAIVLLPKGPALIVAQLGGWLGVAIALCTVSRQSR